MIITIDGPSAAGKSSAAKGLARRLGFQFLNTGAMYRAVALAGLRAEIDLSDEERLAELAATINLQWTTERLYLNGEDVTEAVHEHFVTLATRHAANNPAVRQLLVEKQRQIVDGLDYVSDGRDQGTVVFPHAECKFFISASPEERARRRRLELEKEGVSLSLDEIERQLTERDTSDSARREGPLSVAEDAIVVITDGMSPEEVIDRLEEVVRLRMA